MELDAFTESLGSRQGRVRQDVAGTYVLVLGDLQAHRVHNLTVGDFVEWAQDVDLTGEALVRVKGSLQVPSDVPLDMAWEVSITVNAIKRARLVASRGRTVRTDDLAAFVGDDIGMH